MNHRHLESLILCSCLRRGVIARIVHEDQGIFPPERALSIKEFRQLGQEEQLHIFVRIDLSQREVCIPIRTDCSNQGDPGLDDAGVHAVDDSVLSPSPAPIGSNIDPCLVTVQDGFTLVEQLNQLLSEELP